MIIATVRLRGRDDKRKEILQTIKGIGDQVRSRDGCLSVHSYQDINDRNLFFHVEKWQTTGELDVYLDSKLFSALLGIGTILEEKPRVEFMSSDQVVYSRKMRNFVPDRGKGKNGV